MSESELRRDLDRASRAKQLIEDELLVDAFTTLEAAYIDAWKTSPANETERREKLWQAVQIVGRVKGHLEQVAAQGSLSRAALDEIARRPRRFGIV
jgi:hypothetical protein